MADTTPPVVTSVSPSDGSANIAVDTHVTFDIVDPPEAGTLAATVIGLKDHFGNDNLSASVTGSVALFTTTQPYRSGTLVVWLDGTAQDVTETNPALGTFTLVANPVPGALLLAAYTVDWRVNGVDVSTITVDFNGTLVMVNGEWQPGYSGTITPIDYGYTVDVATHDDFPFGTGITVSVSASDLAEPPNAMVAVFTWAFTTIVPLTRRRPYITFLNPADGAISVAPTANVTFSIRTDNLTATSINTGSVGISLNGVPLMTGGANVDPFNYSIVMTPGTRTLDVVIDPVASLPLDTVYTVTVVAADNTGTLGGGIFQFSTGAEEYATVLARTEPLLCPNDNVPVPFFTKTDISSTEYATSVISVTTDWSRSGLAPYDTVEIASGPDAGRWVIRDPGNTVLKLYHVNAATANDVAVATKRKTYFADRNPVNLITSPMMDLHHQRVWGNTTLRYFAGNPSDDFFPDGWESAVYSVITDAISDPAHSAGSLFEDQTNHRLDFNLVTPGAVSSTVWDRYSLPFYAKLHPTLTNTATTVSGSTFVSLSGTTYRTELTVGVSISFGTETTRYTVAAIDPVLHQITLATPWVGTGTVAGQSVTRYVGGTRSITAFMMQSVTDGNASVFIGLNNTSGSPVNDGNSRIGAEFLFGQNGTENVIMRGWNGSAHSDTATGISHEQFCSKEWVLEIEMLDEVTAAIRLLDFDDLATTPVSRTVTLAGNSTTAVQLDRWTITSFGGGLGVRVYAKGYIRHVDFEPGTGYPFVLAGNVTSGSSKQRAYRNVQPLLLSGPDGWQSIACEAAIRKASPYPIQYSQIFLDAGETHAFIDSFSIDGGMEKRLDRGLTTERLVKKFSFNAGFDKIRLSFHANKRGWYYVLVDSADTVNGFTVASGEYPLAGTVVSLEISGRAFRGLAEGLHQLHIAVCKDPIPALVAVLNGEATLSAAAQIA